MQRDVTGHLIDVSGLGVRYGPHSVLHGVDLLVESGEFLGIVGPNGGGKTTFLRALLGLVPPDSGTIRLFGSSPAARKVRRRLAYVPQNAVHVDPRFPATAYETVMLGRVGQRGMLRRLGAEDRDHVEEAMREVDVSHLADHQVGTLSGGQRQRVFLAQALATDPELLILDEPTTGVDPAARESFYRLLDHLNHDHGMTVLLVSHDTHALVLTAHRIVALNHRVVYDGPPEDFHEAGGAQGAYSIHVPHEEVGHPERADIDDGSKPDEKEDARAKGADPRGAKGVSR